MTPNQAAASTANRQGIHVVGRTCDRSDEVLSPLCLEFVEELVRRFQPAVEALLSRRRIAQARYDTGERPNFLPETTSIRESAWTVAPIPRDLSDRRVEITGPVDRKMIINALNSGASVFMADFEDSTAPRWDNLVSGQANLIDAVRGTIAHDDGGKSYRLIEKPAVLMVRPRGWHLPEKHVEVDGHPIPAALFDFGVFFFHNARALVGKGTGPYFYLPKLQGHLEARLWNEVFVHAQGALGLPNGTIRATVLIETLPAAFEMDEILWELRDHAAGLNCGRWDYIFSFIKVHKADARAVLPDRAVVTMDQGFLRAYSQLLVKTCHRRRIHAMGGMAAQIPIKNDAAANAEAMAKVVADKAREAASGHDGTWVAHPGLVPVARGVFDAAMPGANQIHDLREAVAIKAAELLAIPEGPKTAAGLRWNLRVGIQYLEAWLRGTGCVPLYHLMEDAATCEISRTQVWQWLRHRARLADGREVTPALVRELLASEVAAVRDECGPFGFEGRRFADAVSLFERLLFSDSFEEFLTLPAYDFLVDVDRSTQA
ncbi:MAG TPA: malate synthase A [Candidatus Polarisedimenticolaceae bacterium]|nr:malate synthase A [Candidatus Polarisedimenticolaceae bacterium]